MTDQFFKPKPISYGKSSHGGKLRRYLIWTTGILTLVAIIWLLIIKFSASPFDKMEKYLRDKDIKKAAILNYEMLEKYPQNRLAILMNGTVINFAVRELNITDNKIPFVEYEDQLEMEDRSGVFMKQAFVKKYSLFPDSPYFLGDFCKYSSNYPDTLSNPEMMVVLKKAFQSQTQWSSVDQSCLDTVFSTIPSIQNISGETTGDNVTLRQKPEIKAKGLGKLKKGTQILVKYTGFEESIGNKSGKWLFIMTPDGTFGWIFGGYVKLN